MKRCELCKCEAVDSKFSFRVCAWHRRFGEDGPPCPRCRIVDYKWTYTSTGDVPKKRVVEMRQICLKKQVFLDSPREMVLDIECVTEPAPAQWPRSKRFTTVMIGVGQQIGTDYWITQWATDWERELLEAARPTLALATKIYFEGRGDFDTEVLAARWVSKLEDMWDDKPLWPAIDVRRKALNVRSILKEQGIGACVPRVGDIRGKDVYKYWRTHGGALGKTRREFVWKHNYLDVLDLTHKVFQIEWPTSA